jgi:hypothetical protein
MYSLFTGPATPNSCAPSPTGSPRRSCGLGHRHLESGTLNQVLGYIGMAAAAILAMRVVAGIVREE